MGMMKVNLSELMVVMGEYIARDCAAWRHRAPGSESRLDLINGAE